MGGANYDGAHRFFAGPGYGLGHTPQPAPQNSQDDIGKMVHGAEKEIRANHAGNISPLQEFFLARFEYMVEQRNRYAKLANPPYFEKKLLEKAIYSTYLDLVNLGLIGNARLILLGRQPTL